VKKKKKIAGSEGAGVGKVFWDPEVEKFIKTDGGTLGGGVLWGSAIEGGGPAFRMGGGKAVLKDLGKGSVSRKNQ